MISKRVFEPEEFTVPKDLEQDILVILGLSQDALGRPFSRASRTRSRKGSMRASVASLQAIPAKFKGTFKYQSVAFATATATATATAIVFAAAMMISLEQSSVSKIDRSERSIASGSSRKPAPIASAAQSTPRGGNDDAVTAYAATITKKPEVRFSKAGEYRKAENREGSDPSARSVLRASDGKLFNRSREAGSTARVQLAIADGPPRARTSVTPPSSGLSGGGAPIASTSPAALNRSIVAPVQPIAASDRSPAQLPRESSRRTRNDSLDGLRTLRRQW
jgi:hypothetical protein